MIMFSHMILMAMMRDAGCPQACARIDACGDATRNHSDAPAIDLWNDRRCERFKKNFTDFSAIPRWQVAPSIKPPRH
jgi:hypothetical protein